jgi:hypothetical protein
MKNNKFWYRGGCRNCGEIDTFWVLKRSWTAFALSVEKDKYPTFIAPCTKDGSQSVYDLICYENMTENEK